MLAIERDNTGNEARRLFLKDTAEFHLKRGMREAKKREEPLGPVTRMNPALVAGFAAGIVSALRQANPWASIGCAARDSGRATRTPHRLFLGEALPSIGARKARTTGL